MRAAKIIGWECEGKELCPSCAKESSVDPQWGIWGNNQESITCERCGHQTEG